MTWEQMVGEARFRAAEMNRIDRMAGAATPQDCGAQEVIRTAMLAIKAGVSANDWTCVADAYVLLERLERSMH